MIGPAWLASRRSRSDRRRIAYLAAAPDVAASEGREIQIGGPDVLSYGEMLDLMADALGVRRRPRVPVPLITPWLSSLWIGLVTPVDAGVARPLVEGFPPRPWSPTARGPNPLRRHADPVHGRAAKALAEDPEGGAAPRSDRIVPEQPRQQSTEPSQRALRCARNGANQRRAQSQGFSTRRGGRGRPFRYTGLGPSSPRSCRAKCRPWSC